MKHRRSLFTRQLVLPVVLVAVVGLVLPSFVTGVKHVDIFKQFEDGSYDEPRRNGTEPAGADESGDENGALRTEQPTSCVEDVLPTDPLELPDKLEAESEPPTVPVRNLAAPDLPALFGPLTGGGIFGQSLLRIGENVRRVVGSVRSRAGAYVDDMVARFEQARYRTVGAVRQKVEQLNERIRTRFEAAFVEYRDVCLPDESQCMRLLHTQIEQYEQRLRTNVDECHDRLADELASRRRAVSEAQRQMDGPFRALDRCLDRDAGPGRSFLACTGSAVSNVATLSTRALRSFAHTMDKLSGSLERRVDKFDKCVVKRHRLMHQNEQQVSATVKRCFEKRSAQPDNFFR